MESVTIQISKPMLQIILAGLGELPYKVARPVVDEFDRQIQEQINAEEISSDGKEPS